ncbi:MAG TPA: PrsW family intramembrane metalloprotease [Pseudonocardia sp.]|jgi:RsiW-degrading membrane proteinase PrsW (M82 family)|nr:PrsW family intramembrane metalloprotease [Pseudonocardia sp.]
MTRVLGPRLGSDPVWRLPALWMTFALLAAGLVVIGTGHTFVVSIPLALVASIVLFAAHGLLVFLLVRGLDLPVPRPRPLLGVAVGWGGLVAAGLTYFANAQLDDVLVKLAAPRFVAAWSSAIEAPVTEESLKALGVATVVLLARRRLTGASDGLFYGALVGLGFADIENIHQALVAAAGQPRDSTLAAVLYLLGRGLLWGWAMHVPWTAVAGAGVVWAAVRRNRPLPVRLGVALLALLAAAALHALWDSPLGWSDTDLGRTALVMLAILAPVGVLTWLALRDQARRFAGELGGLADPTLADAAEIGALGSPLRRFGVCWNAYVLAGRGGLRAVRRLQGAQAELAVALTVESAAAPEPTGGTDEGGYDEPRAAGERVRDARQRLEQLVPPAAVAWRAGGRGNVMGWVALGSAVVALAGLPVAWAVGGMWQDQATLATVVGASAGLAALAVQLCLPEVQRARESGATTDVWLGVAQLLGVVGLGLTGVLGLALLGIR